MIIDTEAVGALVERARREVDSGLLPAAQFALAVEGEIVVSEALGDCTTDTRFHTYSAVKPTVALTAMELAAEGLFDIGEPVSAVLESFGASGKEAITVSQVMLHSGGFPYAPLGRTETTDRAARLAAYASWRTDWEPGTRFEYHALSAHWVLAGDDGRAGIRGHGHGAPAEAFGHGGAAGQLAWADPASGLSFAYLTNGLDRNDLASARRRVALSTRALACVKY